MNKTSKNIEQAFKSEGIKSEVITDNKTKYDYMSSLVEKFYIEINPNQVTLKNKVIYLNSSDSINDNAYLFMLEDLYREASSTHSSCLNLRTDMVIGNGLKPINDDPATWEFLDRINGQGDNWQNIWDKIVYDYQHFGMFALQVLYSENGKIVDVYHTDMTTVRATTQDNDEFIKNIEKWALSDKWADIRTKNRYTPNNSATIIDNFNPKKYEKSEYRQLLVHRKYNAGMWAYGLPHYNSVINYIKLDHELAKYHLNKVAGGFFPNVIVTMPGNPDDEEKQRFTNKFKNKYLGADREKLLFIWQENDEDPVPKIIPFDTNDQEKVFDMLNQITTQKILTAHQVIPELASLPTQGSSLGGDANKINVSRSYMIESVIKPIQKSMLQTINKIMRHNGFNDVTVENEVLKLNPDDQLNDKNTAETN